MTSPSTTMNAVIKNFYVEMIADARNSRRENLIHYACRHKCHECITLLLEQGVSLCEQDYRGRTPIHTAIDMGHQSCIEVFQQLFQSYTILSEPIQKQLCAVLQCYNDGGHTILHEVVLKDMGEFARILLQFCQQQAISVADYEVLGCGDSILHLAVRENFLVMAQVICEYVPKLLTFPNYSGTLPGGLLCITEEMKIILHLRIREECD